MALSLLAVFSINPVLLYPIFSHLLLILPYIFLLQMYEDKQIQQALLAVAKQTKMQGLVISTWQELNGADDDTVPQELGDEREAVLQQYMEAQESAQKLLDLIESGDVAELLANGEFNFKTVEEKFDITAADVEALYAAARFQYDCGEYDAAARCLYFYRALVDDHSDEYLQAQWGKLAAEISSESWDEAKNDWDALAGLLQHRSKYQSSSAVKLAALEQRCWLLHWSLFVFFNTENGMSELADCFLQPQNVNIIQQLCPWLLRYVIIALVVQRRRRSELLSIGRLLRADVHGSFRDPIITFIEDLQVNCDLEGAAAAMVAAEQVFASDYFLATFGRTESRDLAAEFMAAAKSMYFEQYCHTHSVLDLKAVSEAVGMPLVEADHLLAGMIREGHLDAKIDAKTDTVLIQPRTASVHQVVASKTRDLVMRTRVLSDDIERAILDVSRRKVPRLSSRVSGGRGRGGKGRRGRGGGRGRGRGGRR